MTQDFTARGKDVLAIEIEGLQSVQQRIDVSFNRAVELLANCRGRVAVTGMGKSGLVGRKIAATLSSTGTPSFFLHPAEGAHGDLGAVRAEDVVLAISYSGKSAEVNAILPSLRKMGVSVISLTSGMHSEMATLSDVVIDCFVPKEACPMNLAPTASTTATLAIGDALAVCLIDIKSFTANDFKRFHPGGALGQRLSLSVKDIMHMEEVPIAETEASLESVLHILDKGKLGAVLLQGRDKTLEGIVTDGDIRRIVCDNFSDMAALMKKPASGIMTRNPLYAMPEQSAAELIDIMEQKSITVLPVLNSARQILGVVHMHDLLGKGQVRFADHQE